MQTVASKLAQHEQNIDDVRRYFNSLLSFLYEREPSERFSVIDRMDEEQLFDSGIFNDNFYKKKKNRINTKTNFEQQKFNRFKEETEGFAKVIVELLHPQNLNSEERFQVV